MTIITPKIIVLSAILLFSFGAQAQSLVSIVNHTENNSYNSSRSKKINEKVNYDLWGVLLKKNVNPKGVVDYEGFKKDSDKFNEFLRQLSRVKINSSWTKADKMAFWINVYNAYTVKLIVNNYPLSSIKEIKNPWKQKFFAINGTIMNLSQVEHNILRSYGDPRIHFAINCASASCPRLIQVPFTAGNLERLLERQNKEFINDPFHNTITGYTVNISNIFDWYKKDFKEDSGTVTNFINKYSNVNIGNQKEKGYKPYDLSLIHI